MAKGFAQKIKEEWERGRVLCFEGLLEVTLVYIARHQHSLCLRHTTAPCARNVSVLVSLKARTKQWPFFKDCGY